MKQNKLLRRRAVPRRGEQHGRLFGSGSLPRVVLLLVSFAVLWPMPVASAADLPLVVVLQAPPSAGDAWIAAERRLIAELAASGFDTRQKPAERAMSEIWQELAQVTALEGALAAVRIARSEQSGEALIWVKDVAHGRSDQYHVRVNQGPDAAAALVLRAVELLHANWSASEAPTEPKPMPRALSPVATPAALSKPERRHPTGNERPASKGAARLWLLGGPLLVLDASELGPSLAFLLAASWRISPQLACGVSTWAQPIAATRWLEASRVSVRSFSPRAAFQFEPWPDAWISPHIGLEAGALWVSADAGDGNYRGGHASTLVSLVALRPGVGLTLQRGLKAVLIGAVAWGLPAPTIRKDGSDELSTLAAPIFDVGLALSWGML